MFTKKAHRSIKHFEVEAAIARVAVPTPVLAGGFGDSQWGLAIGTIARFGRWGVGLIRVQTFFDLINFVWHGKTELHVWPNPLQNPRNYTNWNMKMGHHSYLQSVVVVRWSPLQGRPSLTYSRGAA